MRLVGSVLPALLIAGLAAWTPARSAEPPTASWRVIVTASGQTIGHTSETVEETPSGRQIVDTQEVRFFEPGSRTTRVSSRTVLRFDRAGAATSISSATHTGASVTTTEVRLAGDMAAFVRVTPHERRTASLALPPGVRFDAGAGLLAGWDPATTPKLSFPSLDVEAMALDRTTIEAAPGRPDDPAGSHAALRKHYDGERLISVARMLIDAQGEIVSVTQPLFAGRVTFRAADRKTALAPPSPVRLLTTQFIKSPYRISSGARHGHIRFRFGFDEGIAFAAPETAEQRMAADAESLTLDICLTCGPGLGSDRASLDEALKATAWLQSDSPVIRAIAAPVARLRASDARKMELLREATMRLLPRTDFVGHYSALEALSRRAGDCTETAVVLAALGRAAGIPTRVANGLIYTEERFEGVGNTFVPHSWTLAFVDGKWRSFDAATPGFDSTHIALTVGDGDARDIVAAGQLASLLLWRDFAEIRTRPAS